MAQPKPKSSLPKLIIGAAVIGGIAFMMTGNDSTVKTTAATNAAKKPATKNTGFIDGSDYFVRYDPTPARMNDKFIPLVYKVSPGGLEKGQTVDKSLLNIPSNFTGGESSWGFTGTVNVNGKWSALVENSSTAQNAYLTVGQKWKNSTVVKLTENLLTLRDLSGNEKELPMQADIQAMIAKQQADLAELKTSATPRSSNSPFAPMNPGFMGAIGDTSIQPDASGGVAAVATGADPNAMGNGNGYGGRNRGRGGRGGGGGGGRGNRGGGGGGFGNGG